MESRKKGNVTEHIFYFEDDPQKLLYYDSSGKVNWLRFCSNQFASANFSAQEQELLRRYRPIADHVEHGLTAEELLSLSTIVNNPDYSVALKLPKEEEKQENVQEETKQETAIAPKNREFSDYKEWHKRFLQRGNRAYQNQLRLWGN